MQKYATPVSLSFDFFNILKNPNFSTTDKINLYNNFNDKERQKFIKNYLIDNKSDNKYCRNLLISTIGPTFCKDLPDKYKCANYAYLCTAPQNISKVFDFIIQNENPKMQRQIAKYMNDIPELRKLIQDKFQEELDNSMFSNNKTKYVPQNIFYVKAGNQDQIPTQGWKCHIGADNLVDYYRFYKIMNQNIDSGRFEFKCKFISPQYFSEDTHTPDGKISKNCGADFTFYIDCEHDLSKIDKNLYEFLNEGKEKGIQKRHRFTDCPTKGKVSFRYGELVAYDNSMTRHHIMDPNGNLISDNRNINEYKPDFISKNVKISDVFNLSKIIKEKLLKTQDFTQYAQEVAMGMVSKEKLNLFHVYTFDKTKIGQVKGRLENIELNPGVIKYVDGNQYNGQWVSHTMELAGMGVALIPVGCEIELQTALNDLYKRGINLALQEHPEPLSEKINNYRKIYNNEIKQFNTNNSLER